MSYILDPSADYSKSLDRKRRRAELLIEKGTDSSPVQHWSQGLNRIAQAMLGGYEQNRLEEQDKQMRTEGMGAISAMLGVGGGSGGGESAGAQPQTATPPVAPQQQPSASAPVDLLGSIKKFEGFAPTAGWDYKQYTNGYGTRAQHAGEKIDQATAEQRLNNEVAKAQQMVTGFAPTAPEGVRNALTSLTFNAGSGWQKAGLGQLVKAGDWNGVKSKMLEYNKAGGVTLPGLAKRRQEEASWIDGSGSSSLAGGNVTDKVTQTMMAGASPSQGKINPQIAEMIQKGMSNPYSAPFAMKMLETQMTQGAKSREFGFQALPDGTVLRTNAHTGQVEPAYQASSKPVTVGHDQRLVDPVTGRVILQGDTSPDYRPLNDPAERAAYGIPENDNSPYQINRKGQVSSVGRASTTVNVNQGGSDKQIFEAVGESAAAARSAAQGLKAISQARAALESGGIFGAGADTRLGLQKLGALMGVGDTQQIQNTETFRAAIAPQVAAMLKATVGTSQISNTDRDFAEKAAGGSISLDEGSIKRLMGIMENASNAVVQGHAARLDKIYPDGKGFDRERALFGIGGPTPKSENDPLGLR